MFGYAKDHQPCVIFMVSGVNTPSNVAVQGVPRCICRCVMPVLILFLPL